MTSRSQRKQRSLLDGHRGRRGGAPTAVGWWIGVLLTIGSLCFALGSAPRYVDAVGVTADAVTYFVGSLFFTTAAARQLVWRPDALGSCVSS